MKNRGSFLYRQRTAILFILILMWIRAFAATHIPARYIPSGIAGLGDIVLHGIGFLGLSSWFILTVTAFGIKPVQRILLVLLVMMVYGAVDEYTQQFFWPVNRTERLADRYNGDCGIADTVGNHFVFGEENGPDKDFAKRAG